MYGTKQVYLHAYGVWADVINESDDFYAAIDIDGVNVIVAKDGTALVRVVS